MALFGLAACSGGGNTPDGGADPTPPAQGMPLASFEPCTFFKPEELSSFGVATQGKDFSPVKSEPGCAWDGEKMSLSIQKNLDQTVETYGANGSWDSYQTKTIAGRPAAIALESGATDTGSCSALVNAGGGVAIYMLDGLMRDTIPDPCDELEKIVNQTASRLPE